MPYEEEEKWITVEYALRTFVVAEIPLLELVASDAINFYRDPRTDEVILKLQDVSQHFPRRTVSINPTISQINKWTRLGRLAKQEAPRAILSAIIGAAIKSMLSGKQSETTKNHDGQRYIYPDLYEVLTANKISRTKFAQRAEISETTLRRVLKGRPASRGTAAQIDIALKHYGIEAVVEH